MPALFATCIPSPRASCAGRRYRLPIRGGVLLERHLRKAAGSWVFAGAWADPVRTSRAASIEGASQRDERVIGGFMLGVSLADDDPYNSKVRPRDGPLQVVKDI